MTRYTRSDHLSYANSGGVIELFGRRALLLDADVLRRLRGELEAQLGPAAARRVLERLGHDHGRTMATLVRRALPDYWRSDQLGHIPALLGHSELVSGRRLPGPGGPPVYEFRWANSVEAARPARADTGAAAACWGLCAFAAGFVSEMEGRAYRFVEDECEARGDPGCRMVGQALAETNTGAPDAGGGPGAPALAASAEPLVSGSPAMRTAIARARLVAQSTATVLIAGESGVGKELIARLLHDTSPRASGPFRALNCAAMSEALLESELFGHARGAFTGAERDTPGIFEAAHGGTLLLDEVGEMPAAMQAKLLRALEERTVRRIGETRERPFDARIVCATNRPLEEEVAAGRFREDLLYRLRVVEIEIPPLRARSADILPLARLFLHRFAIAAGLPVREFTPAAEGALTRHAWPGNVRELRNAVERAVILGRGPAVDIGDLPPELHGELTRRASGVVQPLAAVERQCIEEALRALGGDKRRAAAELGIGLATLYRKLRGFAESPPEPDQP